MTYFIGRPGWSYHHAPRPGEEEIYLRLCLCLSREPVAFARPPIRSGESCRLLMSEASVEFERVLIPPSFVPFVGVSQSWSKSTPNLSSVTIGATKKYLSVLATLVKADGIRREESHPYNSPSFLDMDHGKFAISDSSRFAEYVWRTFRGKCQVAAV